MTDPWALTLAVSLSIGAALISLGSLAWNIVSWSRSGARVRIRMALTYEVPGSGTITDPSESWPASLAELGAADWSPVSLEITVRSVGRSAVTIDSIGVGTPTGSYVAHGNGASVKLPHTIPAGGASIRYTTTLADLLRELRSPSHLRARVELGDGRVVTGRPHRLPSL